MDFDIPTRKQETLGHHDSSQLHAQRQAEALATSFKETWIDLIEAIQTTQAWVSSRENQKHHNPTLAAGDLASLDTRHLSHRRLTPKPDYYWTGPVKVEAINGGSAMLSLPASLKIHPTVNVSCLRRFDNDPLPGQAMDAECSDPVIAGEDPLEDEFEVTCILDVRINRQYRGGRLQFRVAWHHGGWPDNPTWYNTDDGEFSHTKEALVEFYALLSTKVRPPRSARVSLPSPPTDKSWDKPFFPRGGWCYGLQALYMSPLNPYVLSLNPLLYISSCTHTLVQP